MRDRKTLLQELVINPKTVKDVLQELSLHGWYCEQHFFVITKRDVLETLKQFLQGKLSSVEVRDWANAVGGRPDLGYEFGPDGVVEESLYWLAHPDLEWPINRELYEKIVNLYERRKTKRN